MHLTTPAVPLLLALATPLAAQAAGTRAQPVDDVVATDTVTTEVEPGTPATVTRTEVSVIPVAHIVEDADHGRTEGRHRLHIDTDAFAWRRWNSWTGDDAMDEARGTTDSLSVLGGAPMFGVPGIGPAGNVTLGYGYGIRKRVVLGARLGLGWQQFTSPEAEKSARRTIAYQFTPYVELVFRPGFKVRPYLGARVGLGGSTLTDVADNATSHNSTLGPILGVSGGLHAFVTERVSLDAALTFDYALAYARSKMTVSTPNNPNDMEMTQKTDFARSARLPNAAFVVGLSVWLGRDRSERDRRDDDRLSKRR